MPCLIGHWERHLRGIHSIRECLLALLALCLVGGSLPSRPAPPVNLETGLPPGSELDTETRENPREVFHSEVTEGRRSYLSSLGNLAFNSPSLLGEAARKAGISCGTCHVNGASNPRLFIPGLSSRPGTFDTTNALFDPALDNHVPEAFRIPSLRGARFLAPYGHEGRFATLRDFVRHAIVNEFSGPEVPAELLDAIVAYIEDIDFLSNSAIDSLGRLTAAADAAQRRGEQIFLRPFPGNPAMSCATCHVPSEAFVDHQLHSVGSGGVYKTPTLLNADYASGYFHDGRFDNYGQVVEYFDGFFALHLSPQDKSDLVAYLLAVGGGAHPRYRLTGTNVLEDCNQFAAVLQEAIAQRNRVVIDLAVGTVSEQLQSLAEHYPTTGVDQPGERERMLARTVLQSLMDALQRIGVEARAGHFDAAAESYLQYRKLAAGSAPLALFTAERWSSFTR